MRLPVVRGAAQLAVQLQQVVQPGQSRGRPALFRQQREQQLFGLARRGALRRKAEPLHDPMVMPIDRERTEVQRRMIDNCGRTACAHSLKAFKPAPDALDRLPFKERERKLPAVLPRNAAQCRLQRGRLFLRERYGREHRQDLRERRIAQPAPVTERSAVAQL